VNEYELMFIVHPEADSDGVTAVSEQIATWIGAQGGEVTQTNVWGRRKLAYALDKQNEGSYVLMHLRLAGTALAEVERNIRLDEKVLRYMFVRQGE
jgi:small subunit ribosomal protein S6